MDEVLGGCGCNDLCGVVVCILFVVFLDLDFGFVSVVVCICGFYVVGVDELFGLFYWKVVWDGWSL